MGLADRQRADLPAATRAARRASSASTSATRPAITRSSSSGSAPRPTRTGNPIEGSGFLAPVVRADKCVGCGLCQTRCYGINVAEKGLLRDSAIVIEAGEGKEDRLMTGSYVALREQEARRRADERRKLEGEAGGKGYLPDFLD